MNTLRLVHGGGGPRALASIADDSESIIDCACGEAWFDLVQHDSDKPAAMSLQADGRIAAVTGELRCVSCGDRRPWT